MSSEFVHPPRLWSRTDVPRTITDANNCRVYAWFVTGAPPEVPVKNSRVVDDAVLLYVGISRRQPPLNGRCASSKGPHARIRYLCLTSCGRCPRSRATCLRTTTAAHTR
ncbi:hypothetical protein HP550_20310 [Cellulomonas humilata]|uniref:Uncharacterized protein n=1 Tax=Cellulomonas humilata TaxID=144055 RepID=A0A7Y6A6V9_9CELL|nr:hypothetical protein [Cellulomonas humilata]NUU19594.1 hypothetical protein [Cellulomonas humilata]